MRKKQNKSISKTTLGEKIRFYRYRLEMSQEELALEAGISLGSVSEIENNVNIPTQTTIHKLASALQLTPKEIAYIFDVNLYLSNLNENKRT